MDFTPNTADLPQPDLVPLEEIEPHLEAGSELFTRFVLVEKLGYGRCSTSWLVEDPRFRRSLVLKLFRSDSLEATAEERTIWRNYLRRLRVLNHPDIVMTMEFFHEGSRIALSNAYENGDTLAGLTLKIGKILPQTQTESALKTIGLALIAAYEKFAIVHGNLNPYNIIISNRRGTPKVADFGFHPPLPPPEMDRREPRLGWKLACLSPERLAGAPPSHLDDIYAFAAIAYQMFTGKNPPLQDDGSLDLAAASQAFQSLGNSPNPWREQILLALSPDPQARPQTLTKLFKNLDLYEEFDPRSVERKRVTSQNSARKKPRTSKSPDNNQRWKRIRLRILTTICVITAPALIGYIVYHNDRNQKALEAERFKGEVAERALEAEEAARVVQLNDRLSNNFTPSKSNLELYRKTMTEPMSTPKPTPIVVNTGARDFYREGQAKMSAGNPQGAMESYELAIVLQSDWPELLEARGAALLASQKPADAILEYSKALIIEPERLNSLLGRARAHLEVDEKRDALEDIQAVLKIAPENAEAKELIQQNDLQILGKSSVE